MLDEDIVIPIAGMVMVVVLSIGVPLVVALIRKWERQAKARPVEDSDTTQRLERIEQAIEAMAIEVERVSEGQRFVSRLMADREPERASLSARGGPHVS